MKTLQSNLQSALNKLYQTGGSIAKYQDSGKMMTRSQAIEQNASMPEGAYMYNVGTEEDPAFLYPSELKPSSVTASGDAWRKKQLDMQVAAMMSPKQNGVVQDVPRTWLGKLWNKAKVVGTKLAYGAWNPYDVIMGQGNRHGIIDRTESAGLSVAPTVVDLTSDAYAANSDEITQGTDLFNEFTEIVNPNIHSAWKWKTLPSNYLLTDGYNMPLNDISLYQGVENGTYKIMPLDQFGNNTTVIPVRGAGVTHPRLTSAQWVDGRPSYKYDNDSTYTGLTFPAKGTIGNENGGMFINKPGQLDSAQVAQINNFLQQYGPAYMTLQDSGSNSQYEVRPGDLYSDQGLGYRTDNTMIFGKHVK